MNYDYMANFSFNSNTIRGLAYFCSPTMPYSRYFTSLNSFTTYW